MRYFFWVLIKKKLLKYNSTNNTSDIEVRYKNAFENLYLNICKTLVEKTNKRKNEIDDRKHLFENQQKHALFFIDKYFDIIDKILEICENTDSMNNEVIELIQMINQTITGDVTATYSSKEFNQICNEGNKLISSERLKSLFKR